MSQQIPEYIASAKPVPPHERPPWYRSTAPTYAGIMLWFVFWNQMASGGTALPGGTLAQGLGVAFLGLVVAALICHFLFYLSPGLLGMKSGLPLYIVGSSTYGARGGLLMPGFLMGVLQFGWLGVNAYFSSYQLATLLTDAPRGIVQNSIAILFVAVAAFLGVKGIQYVAKVATFLPLLPLVILLILLGHTAGGLAAFDPAALVEAGQAAGNPQAALGFLGVIALCITYVVGFFATAGAAGVDFGMHNPDSRHVQLGGLTGISLATIFSGGSALLIAAGAFASTGQPVLETADPLFMGKVTGSEQYGKLLGVLLAVAAFPAACFSSFIAANSMRTTLPNVSIAVSVGIGALASIFLALTGLAADLAGVFTVIGASFGPICGAMTADYLLSGRRWAGPRQGFNPAGWISWAVGFVVGMLPLLGIASIPAAPLVAFLVGFGLYVLLARLGLESAPLTHGQ